MRAQSRTSIKKKKGGKFRSCPRRRAEKVLGAVDKIDAFFASYGRKDTDELKAVRKTDAGGNRPSVKNTRGLDTKVGNAYDEGEKSRRIFGRRGIDERRAGVRKGDWDLIAHVREMSPPHTLLLGSRNSIPQSERETSQSLWEGERRPIGVSSSSKCAALCYRGEFLLGKRG